jgi:hypothetical protein
MTMASSFGTNELPLEVLWQDGERVFCRTWRLGADGRQEFIAVRSAAERPTPDTVARLTHEYELKDYIDSEWAVRPLELVHERGQTVLVLESPGGRPLDRQWTSANFCGWPSTCLSHSAACMNAA